MTALVERALKCWGFDGARHAFVAGRENLVYRVHADCGDFALRIRRPGYRSEAELRSELLWLDAMDRAGLSVPRPRPTQDGRLLARVGERFVDMIGWLKGEPMGQGPLDLANARRAFRRLGKEMARLHLACDAWSLPAGFVRCKWDVDGLLGEAPVWGRFWQNPTLDPETCDLLERFRVRARADLAAEVGSLDFGLIHADLMRENVLFDGPIVRLLDFDDGGFGFRLFDVATALLRNMGDPNYVELKVALTQGYQAERPLDIRHLDLFIALRAMTYVGWIVPRMTDEGAQERNQRFAARARQLANGYLSCPI